MLRHGKHIVFALLLIISANKSFAFNTPDSFYLHITVTNDQQQPLEFAIVSLLNANNNTLVKTELTDNKGKVLLNNIAGGSYYCSISFTGHTTDTTAIINLVPGGSREMAIILHAQSNTLQNVTVQSVKPLVQFEQGKVIVNVDASPTNAGTSILDVLEKSPGVTVDKNGGISLKAKPGVLILIDGKQTYLSGADLNNLLSSMSSSQVDQIELMVNPSARYDANGNAGIINIRTKKNKQRGFNGSYTATYSQGRYPKANTSINLNYRNGKVNSFFNYSYNYNRAYSDLYALRTYYDEAGNKAAVLDQPTLFTGKNFNHTLKTGLDFFASSKTSFGIAITGILTKRKGNSDATATWLGPDGGIDSSIKTLGTTDYRLVNAAVNLNMKHSFSKKQDISVDLDWLHYDIHNQLYFSNSTLPSTAISDASDGDIPSTLKILTGKADYTLQLPNNGKFDAGWKSSHINTDNLADYDYYDGHSWQPDYGKSNHFLYTEDILAFYNSVDQQLGQFTMQLGLRYENTSYNASQLGNAVRKDSAFTRKYDGFFPSGFITWQADSSNSFTFTAGRRVDRPPFQQLNPFVFIVNKYTYQTGNPYMKPQYSWNLELSHQYKNYLTTTLSYSFIKDYFSQLFLTDSVGILYYSQGNVGKAYIAGLSLSTQVSPAKWWSLTAQALVNYKKLKGYVWNEYASDIWQFNISANNQFKISDRYTAELSGFYTSPARNDLQEKLLPTGQLNIGLARPVLKKKGTLKLSIRDIFHTMVMEGNTDFEHAHEYFIIRRDSRVISISFTYRFGKPLKSIKRSSGAEAEMERVNG
ncbi:MAG TPA: TonB-dependent receptor [Panacibacter sp.]|nr:TonB-dependent receptor [Panacibacter sp.]HNP42822.1 TonB-dependent receptor [Panacibacter sp.]